MDDLNLNLKFDVSFFNEERKCGFLVTKRRKELWAVQLDLLDELQRICNKNGLKIIACGGTLLGAVRHKGFIPWDDDIDVCMLRDDYDKLIHLPKEEFKSGYFLQSVYTDNNIKTYLQFKKDGTAMFSSINPNFDNHNGIGIDIFVFDFVPENEKERKKFISKLHRAYRKIKVQNFKKVDFNDSFIHNVLRIGWDFTIFPLKKIMQLLGYYSFKKVKKRYIKWDKMCASYNHKTKLICSAAFASCQAKITHHNIYILLSTPYSYNSFLDLCKLPFENIAILCPKNYDYLLTKRYGNYKKYIIGASLHTKLFFDVHNSYKKYIGTTSDKLQQMIDTFQY